MLRHVPVELALDVVRVACLRLREADHARVVVVRDERARLRRDDVGVCEFCPTREERESASRKERSASEGERGQLFLPVSATSQAERSTN